jgi:SagB-type dehydrogenase family enzyme
MESQPDTNTQMPTVSDSFDRRVFSVSETFHENTKIRRTPQGHIFVSGEPQRSTPPAWKLNFALSRAYKTYRTRKSIPITKNLLPLTNDFEQVLRSRQSTREYSGAPVSFDYLSRILELSYGTIEGRPSNNGDLQLSRRVVPSAGALYPIEMYLVALRVEGLEPGLYHYHPQHQALDCLRVGERIKSDIENAVLYPEIVSQASTVFLLAAVFQRARFKYGERGYRFVLLDSGHIAQNIYLVSAALGLGAVTMGGYIDDELNQMLDECCVVWE